MNPRHRGVAVGALALAFLCSACASLPWPGLRPQEGRKVRAIVWEGAEQVPPAELEAAILTAEASWKPWVEDRPFDAGTLEQDLERLRRFYRRKGFYEAELRSEVEERGRSAVRVRIHVTEGPTVTLEDLDLSLEEVAGDTPLPDADALRRDLALTAGEPFSEERYAKAKQQLLERLAGEGRPAATISGGAAVSLEDQSALVSWSVAPGPFVRLGEARAVGLERVAPDLVLGEVAWEPGAPYQPKLLRRTQRAIFDLGLFRSVSAQPLPPDRGGAEPPLEEEWPVEIRVRERPPRALRASIGFGTEELVRAKVEWKHRNFFGGLRSLRLGVKYSFLERGGEAVFVQPRFLDRKTVLTLSGLLADETQPAYEARGVSAGWLLERPLLAKWSGRLGQRLEMKRVTDIEANSPVLGSGSDETFRLVLLDLGLRRSALDSELDPRSGTWLDFSLEPSLRPLGSEIDYVKGVVEARGFLPLPLRLVLASRVRLGTLQPFGGTSSVDLPVFKRFFSGGSTSVRGFDLDELGPVDAANDPIGGLTVAEGSLELRFPIWRDVGGVVFGDAGQVDLRAFRLRPGGFFYSAGAGLRYKTPIGPLRLDFGRILNPRPSISSWAVHFSVGHAF